MAAGLPALMVLLLGGLSVVGAVATRLQCVDAAREGAIAAARGEPGTEAAAGVAPEGARIAVSLGDGTAVVTVEAGVQVLGADLPAITVRATATAALEPQGD